MIRLINLLLFLSLCWSGHAQRFSISAGVYSGMTASYTADEGIKKDSRYQGRFEAKLAPIGINFGVDYERFGLMVSPGLVSLGQNFYLVNNFGGQEGLRKTDLKYVNVPVTLKFHLVHFTAFKLSALLSVSPAFLLEGEETLSHQQAKLQFPDEVYSILPSNYIVEYDGVLAPEVNNLILGQKKDFKPMQLFAGAGFRTDWDPSNHWRISLDFRVNYGIFDPRTKAYTHQQESTLALYTMPGERRDMFAQITLGISRYIEIELSEKERKKKLNGTTKKYRPQYPNSRPRQSRPKE
jgi:Outer membrane protein beta-barrel domain